MHPPVDGVRYYQMYRGSRGGHRGSVRERGRPLSRQKEEKPSGSKNSSGGVTTNTDKCSKC